MFQKIKVGPQNNLKVYIVPLKQQFKLFLRKLKLFLDRVQREFHSLLSEITEAIKEVIFKKEVAVEVMDLFNLVVSFMFS